MSILIIKGHSTRGSEVIALLEEFGGENTTPKLEGNGSGQIYYIRDSNNETVCATHAIDSNLPMVFTLEEFEEKYPYKIGDKVSIDQDICTVLKRWWDQSVNEVAYYVEGTKIKGTTYIKDLKPIDKTKFPYEIGTRISVRNPSIKKLATIVGISYNSCACMQYEIKFDGEDVVIHYPTDLMKPVTTEQEPTKECIDFAKHPPLTDKLEIILGNYEIVQENGKCYAVRKSPKYPKTYEECCTILQYNDQLKVYPPFRNGIDKYSTRLFDQLENLRKLKICLDTYREIAGKELGLGKPWEPDWKDVDQDKYVIYTDGNTICTNCFYLGHNILAFPTKEMRDIFYENFRDLIEQCKELL